MATYAIRPIAPVIHNEAYRFVTYPLADSQTFKKGAAVLLNTDGKVEECGADPALVLGFALADAADYSWKDDTFGTADPAVPVALADQTFRGTLEGTYDADGHISVDFGLVKDATGYWTVDETDETNVRVILIGVDDGVVDGDINVPCTFTVISSVRQLSI
jgi:hypothetical protein